MNKTLLIIQREYLSRIRRLSFWVLAVLVPLIVVAVYAIPLVLASRPQERARVLVADDTGLFIGQFRTGREVAYYDAGSLDYARRQLAQADTFAAILYVPARETTLPRDAYLLYRSSTPSAKVQDDAQTQLHQILMSRILLDVHGIDPDDYALLNSTGIRLRTMDIETGRDGLVRVKTVAGIGLAVLLLLAVLLFGSQVMRGVTEEKNNRIVEVIVSSVRPFQLMMGKVVGIGLAGLTQFALWVLLAGVGIGGLHLSNQELFQLASTSQQSQISTKGSEATRQYQAARADVARYEAGEGLDYDLQELIRGLGSIDFALLTLMLLFYFLFGYLLYASLFAAAGAMGDGDTDTAPYILPLSAPLLLAAALLPVLVAAPSGGVAVWLSVIPFTSPVAMLARIPFGVPVWQLLLSMVLLIATFPLCTWVAARIYRGAILRYGQRISIIQYQNI